MKYLKSSALVAALIASAITVGACQRKGEVAKAPDPVVQTVAAPVKAVAPVKADRIGALEARVASLEASRAAARAQFAKLQAQAKAAGFQ